MCLGFLIAHWSINWKAAVTSALLPSHRMILARILIGRKALFTLANVCVCVRTRMCVCVFICFCFRRVYCAALKLKFHKQNNDYSIKYPISGKCTNRLS